MVELNQTDIASEEDKKFGVDRWAKLFKATSREELLMIAQENTSMKEAVNTAYLMNEDERIREAAILQEQRRATLRRLNNSIEELTKENEEQAAQISQQANEIDRLKKEIERLLNQ